VRQDRLRLGTEEHAVRQRCVVQRLHTEPVSGQQKFLAPLVPDAEREHAVQPGHAVRTPLQVGVQHHLGVRARPELVPEGRQLAAELGEVVDLAAEGQHDLVLVRAAEGRPHRLLAAFQVDDRQPSVPDGRVDGAPYPARVRSPVHHRRGHRLDHGPPRPQVTPEVHPSSDPAHDPRLPFRSWAAMCPERITGGLSAH
jgi:hypothetical protein